MVIMNWQKMLYNDFIRKTECRLCYSGKMNKFHEQKWAVAPAAAPSIVYVTSW